MKTAPAIRLAFFATFVLHSSSFLLAQGPLTPPGAPAPTMKTLAQIEPRTPISSAPFTISAPGSYYLITNVTTAVSNAIVITANGVTLDLNGFTISSTVASAANGGNAILLAGSLSDITIVNGHIRSGVTNDGGGVFNGPGFFVGIFGFTAVNVRVSGISVSGCKNYGIGLASGFGAPAVVDSCVVRTVGSLGIIASMITRSQAMDCGAYAISGDVVSDCRGESAVGGIYAVTAHNCYGRGVSSPGINALTANNCYGLSTESQGISAETANNCYGSSFHNRGLSVNVANACSGNSNGGSYGLFATSIASTCYGYSLSGTGLGANIAIGCIGENFFGPSVLATYKYNMP